MQEVDLILQAFDAAGAADGIAYLSTPVTSGRREIALMAELGCDSSTLRSQYREAWLQRVVQANGREALAFAELARARLSPQLVIDPSRLCHPRWSQDDYNAFWKALLTDRATRVIVAPDWAYSKGARIEVHVAVELGIEIEWYDGTPLSPSDIAEQTTAAHDDLARQGWSASDISTYLPPLVLDASPSPQPPTSAFSPHAAHVFSWLMQERTYQVRKFGTDLDDEHTLQGLDEETWWLRQLMTYYHRSTVLGLDNPLGRQALAKYVATACGLLESVVRVYGPLPPAGVPSGDQGGGDE